MLVTITVKFHVDWYPYPQGTDGKTLVPRSEAAHMSKVVRQSDREQFKPRLISPLSDTSATEINRPS